MSTSRPRRFPSDYRRRREEDGRRGETAESTSLTGVDAALTAQMSDGRRTQVASVDVLPDSQDEDADWFLLPFDPMRAFVCLYFRLMGGNVWTATLFSSFLGDPLLLRIIRVLGI